MYISIAIYCLRDMSQIKNPFFKKSNNAFCVKRYVMSILLGILITIIVYTKKIILSISFFLPQKVFPLPEVSVKAIIVFGDICKIKLSKKDTQTKLEKPFHRKPYVSKYFFKVFPPIFTFLKIQYIGTSLIK